MEPFIHRLNFDILTRLFIIAVASFVRPGTLGLVCSRWWSIVRDEPTLFKAVFIGSTTPDTVARARHLLDRSRTHSVSISFFHITRQSQHMCAALLDAYVSRLQAFATEHRTPTVVLFVRSILPKLVNLEELSLNIAVLESEYPLDLSLPRLQGLHTVRLSGLWSNYVCYPSTGFPFRQLTHLELRGTGLGVEQAIKVLSSCTMLESCVLFLDVESGRLPHRDCPVHLPHLAHFRVIGSPYTYPQILTPGMFPTLKYLHVRDAGPLRHTLPLHRVPMITKSPRIPPIISLNLEIQQSLNFDIAALLNSISTLSSLHVDYGASSKQFILPLLRLLKQNPTILPRLQCLALCVESDEISCQSEVQLASFIFPFIQCRLGTLNQFHISDTHGAFSLASNFATQQYLSLISLGTHHRNALWWSATAAVPEWVQMLWPETYHPYDKDIARFPVGIALPADRGNFPYTHHLFVR
ncbi:hypothetical protein BDN72DRAFT_904355 [Pluteus cervinus]|uniref:Uncharacterized protein n=1 Tax=Pluteus cervinus TaxID=181527 RepID=A0ACD3A670_9AGAR|nr:hypothetical protein BDN72DRAFT_904355 [Pluteus cervinus]